MNAQITPFQQADLDKLAHQLSFARQRLQMVLGECEFDFSMNDLELLQRGLDSGAITDRVDLQCLGVPFAHVLMEFHPQFGWWMYTDEQESIPCLRYRETDLVIFPLTLISKRIEQGEQVNVVDLFNELNARLQPICQQLDQQYPLN